MTRTTIALVLAIGATACASAPIAPPPAPLEPSFEQKASWILQLEDARVLRDPAPPPAPPPVAPVPARGKSAVVAPLPPPPPPDLLRLLKDKEARVRRRAALAVGRVGLAEGVPPLVALLTDADPEVRQMAAFALGLIGSRDARDPLLSALGDESPLVKGSAAEALGLIGDVSAAGPIAQVAAAVVASAGAGAPPENTDAARETPISVLRLALNALVRLKSYDGLAAAVLDAQGQPRVRWWPVAYALQRLEDPRALPALLTLVKDDNPWTKVFAAKGLGAMKDRSAVTALLPLAGSPDKALAIEAIRSLGRLKDATAGPMLLKILQTPKLDPQLRLETVAAVGGIGGPGAIDTLIDLLGDPNPAVRGAAIRSLAQIDSEGFVTILSGLDQDANWMPRAALADVLGGLTPEVGLPRLRMMLTDSDARVIPAVLRALARLHPPDAVAILIRQLSVDDPVVRATAANALADLKPPEGVAALTEAYRRGEADQTYVARAAVLAALTSYGAAQATPVLTTALADKDWAVRMRAAALLKQLDPNSDASLRMRPASTAGADSYAAPGLTSPPFSTQVYIDTDRGTIQIELAVLDAPLTVLNFTTLARKGFFDGLPVHRVVPNFVVQAGDPRGDSEGGPGYTIRDELNERPYLRGTVGMALDWADTGGSQFFITHLPQPHLDAKYTVFGRVIAGMELVDQIQPGDVIRRVRVWDGAAN